MTVPPCSSDVARQYSSRALRKERQCSIAPDRTKHLAVACGITLELSLLDLPPDLLLDIITPKRIKNMYEFIYRKII